MKVARPPLPGAGCLSAEVSGFFRDWHLRNQASGREDPLRAKQPTGESGRRLVVLCPIRARPPPLPAPAELGDQRGKPHEEEVREARRRLL